MFCSQCGKKLADGEICTCRQQVQQVKQQGPGAKDVLKKSLSSWLFLTIAILYSVMTLFSFITVLTPTDYTEIFDELDYYIGIEVEDVIDEWDVDDSIIESGILGGKIGSFLLPALICPALWMLYLGARSKKTASVKTGGFTMLQAVTIINLVAFWLVILVAVFAVTGLFVVASGDGEYILGDYIYTFDDADLIVTLCIILYCVLAAVLAFGFVLFYKELKTLSGAKNVAKTGAPNRSASMFLVVVLFLEAGACLVPGAIALSRDFLGAMIILSGATFYFLSAIGLMEYRTAMKKVLQGGGRIPMPQQAQGYTINYLSCTQCGQQYSAGLDKCPKCGNSDRN